MRYNWWVGFYRTLMPPPGVHHLTLIGADGRAQDGVLFTVH